MTLKPADNFYAALQAAGLPAVPREFAVVKANSSAGSGSGKRRIGDLVEREAVAFFKKYPDDLCRPR